MSNDRWLTAIHESAHAVAAITLGGRCSRLVLHDDGGGAAFIDELSPTDDAIATAAASAAEELLGNTPAPEAPALFIPHISLASCSRRLLAWQDRVSLLRRFGL
jgi:hypothetical protein